MKKEPKEKNAQATLIAKWAEEKLGLTAEIGKEVKNFPIYPCKKRYQDISINEKKDDIDNLLSMLQMHTCSSYCLKEMNHNQKK